MKYELLKRSAIALFVGGVVSTYSVAADDDVTNNDETTVSDTATTDEGVIDNKQPAEEPSPENNRSHLLKLYEAHNDLVSDVETLDEKLDQFIEETDAKKADAEEVGKALDTKANASDVYSKTESDSKFALKADNSAVSTQANTLRTDINAHTKRLDHLDNRVNKLDKDLKRGLAAQAALTGLFQPYTVGKANFTAAVGGYKSQTAVAIGTGYRYNQNIATKAGVAFTQGGGVTYNAGVNFEW